MRPRTPDSGQAAKRDSLWVLDIVSSNHDVPYSPLSAPTPFALLPPLEANRCTAVMKSALTMPSRKSRRYWLQRTSDAPGSGLFTRRTHRSRQQKNLLMRLKRALIE